MDQSRKYKILFIAHSLEGGGLEQALINILTHLDRDKLEPQLVLFNKKGVNLKKLPEDIKVHDLKKNNWVTSWLAIPYLARLIYREKPDIIFSFLWRINLISIWTKMIAGLKNNLLISDRILLSAYLNYTTNLLVKRIIIFLVRIFYSKSTGAVVITEQIKQDLINNFSMPPEKISVIPNPIDTIRLQNLCQKKVSHPWFNQQSECIIIGLGRLVKQKGFIYLIKALKIVRTEQNAKLVIIGKGPEEKHLKKLVRQLDLQEHISFVGFQPNPFKYLKQGSIFVLSSLYEGFPMALAEAMALGLPAVATRCPSGPEEIIQDHQNGILIPVADETALARALSMLLKDEKLRQKLGQAGSQRIKDFSAEKIVKKYELLLKKIITENIA